MPEDTINTPDRPFPSPDQIPDWNKLLSDETGIPDRVYVVPKDPLMVELMVAEAVYKTLTGPDLIETQRQAIAGDAPTEELELTYLEIMHDLTLEKKQGGFVDEAEEALKQANLASKADLNRAEPWRVYYDYWQDAVKIGDEVSLSQPADGADYLILQTSVEEIGEDIGFPSLIAQRKFEANFRKIKDENKAEAATDAYDQIINMLEGLGYDREVADRKIRNSSMSYHFFQILGYSRVESILEAAGRPTVTGDRFLEFMDQTEDHMRFVYSQLAPEEQQQITATREGDMSTSFIETIEHGVEKARMVTSVATGKLLVRFDPITGDMEVDFSSIGWMNMSTQVNPLVTPNTRHDGLLALREFIVQKLERAGMTQPRMKSKNR
ncbi:MAG: hypothetical protein UY16_C0046G0005 [Candidatus Gottesmanbacteria bacterium GW2011_GWA2_47_9]|uniref:Uncharacterized protein n=1 Tax=Candidatus Gottesmanbacteria bacterium GW2011_GWA2_47_9 TaxID=1618445 RepID=A0A0G1TYS2_9BACT|nr:MAG: hypothetical protein UY16_C0046G0005 [Candidatus Gottesmanbacteria bacterium GW2011_GWA2_47_9]